MAGRDLNGVVNQLQQMAAGGCGPCDADLLRRFATTGDEAAFELLVRRHERMVLGVCRRLLPDFRDVEDCFQAVFLALARKAGGITKREALAGWLYRVAFRSALTARTKWANDTLRSQPLGEAETLAAVAVEPTFDDSWQIIDQELRRLPPHLRLPLILCYLEGRTVDEAAREIGCPRGTVASRLARGRSRLRGRLSRRGVAPGAALAIVFTAEASAAQSHSLISSASRLAHWWNAGDATARSAVSERVISLTQEVLRAMSIKKITTAALFAIATAGLLLLGGALGFQRLTGADEQDQPKPQSRSQTKPRTEQPPVAKAKDEKATGKHAKVVHPIRRDAPPTQDFSGVLEAGRTLDVVAGADGRLGQIMCKTGATVKKGDTLFEIDSAAAKENLIKAQTNLQAAEAKRKQSEAEITRMQKIGANASVVPLADLERARATAEIDAAMHKIAQIDLDRARRELDATRVVAPGDGTVGSIRVNDGSPVSANKTVLTTIQVLDPMRVVFELDQDSYVRYKQAVRTGQVEKTGAPLMLSVGPEPGWPYKGKILSFDDHFDPAKGTLRVTGILPNKDHELIPGMFIGVRMVFGATRRLLLVPEAAVLSDRGKQFAFVVSDNKAERRPVKLGQHCDDGVEVLEGLTQDDWVAVEGASRLKPRRQGRTREGAAAQTARRMIFSRRLR